MLFISSSPLGPVPETWNGWVFGVIFKIIFTGEWISRAIKPEVDLSFVLNMEVKVAKG